MSVVEAKAPEVFEEVLSPPGLEKEAQEEDIGVTPQPAAESVVEAEAAPKEQKSEPVESVESLLMKKGDTGLRQRKKSTVSLMTDAAADFLPIPQNMKAYVRKVGPILESAAEVYGKAKPYLNKARALGRKVWVRLEPYHPEEWGPIIFGLVLCFFGGCFATIIAAYEAFSLAGYATVKECFVVIKGDYQKVSKEWVKDDKKDDDRNGTVDVADMDETNLAKHKFLLVLRTVDPAEITRAFAGISTGFLAVVAALRVHFAQALTLGAALGCTVEKFLLISVIPKVQKQTHEDYRQWVRPVFSYGAKFIGFALAMLMWRAIMAVHSATKGAQMACSALMSFLVRNKYIKTAPTDTNTVEFLGVSSALALVGFYWQLSHGFTLPFPLSFFLLPVTMVEYFLSYFVAGIA